MNARQPRSGLTRGKAARQIPNLDSTKHLIYNQKKSLARLAGQSMRSGTASSWSVASSGPPSPENGPVNLLPLEEEIESQNPSTIMMPTSSMKNSLPSTVSRSRVPSLSKRDSSFSLDELSLEVLCMHVAELMGGPAIPKASFIPQMEVIQGSTEFDLEGFDDDELDADY